MLDYIRPCVDLYKVDLKGFRDAHYRELGGMLANVLDTIERLHARGFWLEIVTLSIPGFNDSREELRGSARVPRVGVSPDMPVARHRVPRRLQDDRPRGTRRRETLLRAADDRAGRRACATSTRGTCPGRVGDLENTRCPGCGATLVERHGYRCSTYRLRGDGTCPKCGTRDPGLLARRLVRPRERRRPSRKDPAVPPLLRILPFLAGALATLLACAAPQEKDSFPVRVFHGASDASGAEFLDAETIVVADDEDNALRIYRIDGGGMPVATVDVSSFLAVEREHPEADIEGAARAGDRIYWITSHGRSRKGEVRESRGRFFATDVVKENGHLTVAPVGKPCVTLATAIAAAFEKAKLPLLDLNIEALAVTPDGKTLYLGFRAPSVEREGKRLAILLPLRNPGKVVEEGATPDFGDALLWDLGGRVLRSLEYVEAHKAYLRDREPRGRRSRLDALPVERRPSVQAGRAGRLGAARARRPAGSAGGRARSEAPPPPDRRRGPADPRREARGLQEERLRERDVPEQGPQGSREEVVSRLRDPALTEPDS